MKTIGRLAVGPDDPAQAADNNDVARTGRASEGGSGPPRPHLAMAVLMSILFFDLALTASGALLVASAGVAFFTATSVRRRADGDDSPSVVATAEPG